MLSMGSYATLDLRGGPPLASSRVRARVPRWLCLRKGGADAAALVAAAPGLAQAFFGERFGPGRLGGLGKLGRGGWGASHPLRTGEGPPRPCSVQAVALLAQGLVFVLPSGTRSWEARRLVLGGAAAPIAAPSPWIALEAVSVPSLGLAAPLFARPAWLPWPSRGQPLRRRAAIFVSRPPCE